MNKPTPTDKLRRALWLAFQASSPMGMGFPHAGIASKATEATIFDHVGVDKKGPRQIYTDYVSGRMMKTQFKVDEEGKLTISPEDPRSDYQSWCGTYPTGTSLIQAVEKSFQ